MEETKTIDSKSCKEIYVILNKLGLFYKLPEELKKYISENQSLSYEYDFDIDLPLIYQINNEKTKAYISYLYLKYINNSASEKDILLKEYEKNEKAYQEELIEKYNSENIFKSRKTEDNIENEVINEKTELVEYNNHFFSRIINKIKRILYKKDRLKKNG